MTPWAALCHGGTGYAGGGVPGGGGYRGWVGGWWVVGAMVGGYLACIAVPGQPSPRPAQPSPRPAQPSPKPALALNLPSARHVLAVLAVLGCLAVWLSGCLSVCLAVWLTSCLSGRVVGKPVVLRPSLKPLSTGRSQPLSI